GRALVGVLDVDFQAREQMARLPVVAGLAATEHTVEFGRRAGRKQGRTGTRIAEEDIGSGLTKAVTDVSAQVETGPVVWGKHPGGRRPGRDPLVGGQCTPAAHHGCGDAADDQMTQHVTLTPTQTAGM